MDKRPNILIFMTDQQRASSIYGPNKALTQAGTSTRGQADPEILHRVIVNLVGNALKASPKGTTVEIRTIDSEDRMTVEVRDSGCGIPKEFHDSLFDKFTTVESKRKRKSSVGLGLAFCKLAVEAHGGKITVASDEDQGSTFTFHIPKSRRNTE